MKEEDKDKVTYSESVKVNIGDYESREFFLSYQSPLRDGEDADAAFKRAKHFVRKRIDKMEKATRIQTRDFTDFDTKAKYRR